MNGHEFLRQQQVGGGFDFGVESLLPCHKSLTVEKDDYPAVSINKGAVTALRRKLGDLHRIQVDVALNPGNSGGALLDLNGKVVGVVVSGVRNTAVNFVIPAASPSVNTIAVRRVRLS